MATTLARAMQPLRRHPLEAGLLISLLVHAVVLTVHFVAPDAFKLQTADTPLDVVLVNAKSARAPDKPSALAQANLVGGGEHDKQRATSPLPARAAEHDGDTMARAAQQVATLEAEQQRLLTQARNARYAVDDRAATRNGTSSPASPQRGDDARTLDERMARLQAEIDREYRAYQSRPKRGQVTANTREIVYARYYDTLRHKIEHLGTERFPQVGSRRLYGELIVTINVNRNGGLGYDKDGYRVPGVEVTRGSGNAELDRRAVAIVQASAPFGAFSAPMREKYDILEIVTRMTFTRHGLNAAAIASP